MTLIDQEVCLDGALDAYTVTYTNGTGVPSYQWYSNTVNSTLGGTLHHGRDVLYVPACDVTQLVRRGTTARYRSALGVAT